MISTVDESMENLITGMSDNDEWSQPILERNRPYLENIIRRNKYALGTSCSEEKYVLKNNEPDELKREKKEQEPDELVKEAEEKKWSRPILRRPKIRKAPTTPRNTLKYSNSAYLGLRIQTDFSD